MSDLIKREDVQREIQTSFDGGAFRWQDGQDLMDRINALPTASPWHRVEEEMPEKFVNVILANKRGKHYDIDKGWWNGYSFDRCAKGIYRNVTHWMPLPEPPKEGV